LPFPAKTSKNGKIIRTLYKYYATGPGEICTEQYAGKMEPSTTSPDIFERLRSGQPVRTDDPEYHKITEGVNRTMTLSQLLNTATGLDQIRVYLGEITGTTIDPGIEKHSSPNPSL
jgi:hypothetical protein